MAIAKIVNTNIIIITTIILISIRRNIIAT